MGPLMDTAHSSCPKPQKTKNEWKRYVKGASGLFAEYACKAGAVTVLMRPPEQQSTPRRDSTFWGIERPILIGEKGIQSGTKLVTIYPTEVLKGSKPKRDTDIGPSISTQNLSHVVSRASNEVTKEVSMAATKKVNKMAKKAREKSDKEMKEMGKEKKKVKKVKRKAKKQSVEGKQKSEKIDTRDRQGSSQDRTQLSQMYTESTPLGELLQSRRCYMSSYLKFTVPIEDLDLQSFDVQRLWATFALEMFMIELQAVEGWAASYWKEKF
jgi:hypothetical protein